MTGSGSRVEILSGTVLRTSARGVRERLGVVVSHVVDVLSAGTHSERGRGFCRNLLLNLLEKDGPG